MKYDAPRNPAGHPATLTPGNVTHGLYSKRIIGQRAAEIVEGLLELPWTQPIDRLACEEVASGFSLGPRGPATQDGRRPVYSSPSQ